MTRKGEVRHETTNPFMATRSCQLPIGRRTHFWSSNLERPAIVMNPKVHPFSHQLCIANFGARAPLNLFEGSPRRRP